MSTRNTGNLLEIWWPKFVDTLSCLCGWPANLRSHSSIGHGRPAATNGCLYRGCLHLDVLKSTMPQSFEDRAHLVGIITTVPELFYELRNERFGISHSSGRLGQRSRRAHWQRLNPVRSCQQSRRIVFFPHTATSHRATNIDGRGCTLSGASLNSQPDWLLQRYFSFQSEISHWEATVSAPCCCQTRSTSAQSLAHFHIDARSTSLAERRVKSEVQAGSSGLQVGTRSGSGVPVCLLCSGVALARSLTSSIRWSVDHVRPQNQDCDNRPSGFLLFVP